MPTLLPRSAPCWFTDPLVDLLARAGVTPNMLTIVGVAGNILAAVLAGSGEFLAAGLLVLASSSLDMLDGALARATGKATDFGSVFDAVTDRVSEAAVLFGLLVYFGGIGRTEDQQLAFVAVVASRIEGFSEVLTDGSEGLLVQPRDSQALAAALKGLLSDLALRKKMGHEAQKTAKRYDWGRVSAQIIDYYKECMADGGQAQT